MGWQAGLIAGIVVLAVLLPFIGLYLRRRWLTGQGGLFDCAHQKPGDEGGWVLGFARFRHETLQWYRAFSFSTRPSIRLPRGGTSYEFQRPVDGLEAVTLFNDSRVVVLRDQATGQPHNFAMDPDSVMALMSWLESSPPGHHYLTRSAETPP